MNEIIAEKLRQIQKMEIVKEAVYEFLCAYYDIYIAGLEDPDHPEYPEELILPLNERSSGVCEAMCWLVDNRFDLNEGDCFNPLMMAVTFADAPMTEFLIGHGADANYWPDMDELPGIPITNYYLADIDIAYLNDDLPHERRYVQALLRTATVLLRDGKTGSFRGLCLTADAENREVTLSGPHWKY